MIDFVSFIPPTYKHTPEKLEGIREETKGQSEYSRVKQDEISEKE